MNWLANRHQKKLTQSGLKEDEFKRWHGFCFTTDVEVRRYWRRPTLTTETGEVIPFFDLWTRDAVVWLDHEVVSQALHNFANVEVPN